MPTTPTKGYHYECANGHGVWSLTPEYRCERVVVKGKTCNAELKRISGPRTLPTSRQTVEQILAISDELADRCENRA